MVGVFWAGLAVWLLFAIAPIRLMLGLVPRRRSTVTGGLSYQETLGGGQRQGLDDHYQPQMPPCCSPAFQQHVAAAFEALPTPQPANETLLPRQRPALGGAATREPFRPDKQADRVIFRAAASLRASQHATLSVLTSVNGQQGAGGVGAPEQSQPNSSREQPSQPGSSRSRHDQSQPGSSRLVRGLSALVDSVAGGAFSWLWNAPNADDALFSYDWRNASEEARPRSARSAGTTLTPYISPRPEP